MTKVNLKFARVSDDKVALEMRVDGAKRGEMALDANAISGLIDKLVSFRAGMSEQVSPILEKGARLEAVSNPTWVVHSRGRDKVLSVRHPGHGWVSFLLPEDQASALGDTLKPKP